MSILIFFPVTFIWIAIFHHLKNRTSDSEENNSRKFWQLESEANQTRRKDISTLDYIRIPLESLPFQETDDSKLNEIQNCIRTLSEKKILNLNHLTNTELKKAYGPANLEALSEYDTNFTELIRTLSNWGQYLYDLGQEHSAQTVLEYGISCNTDVKNNYILLAKIYYQNHEINKISQLINQAGQLNTLMKSSIISSLEAIQGA